jgi:hypothetical protein
LCPHQVIGALLNSAWRVVPPQPHKYTKKEWYSSKTYPEKLLALGNFFSAASRLSWSACPNSSLNSTPNVIDSSPKDYRQKI